MLRHYEERFSDLRQGRGESFERIRDVHSSTLRIVEKLSTKRLAKYENRHDS
jgi:hypothetical protein